MSRDGRVLYRVVFGYHRAVVVVVSGDRRNSVLIRVLIASVAAAIRLHDRYTVSFLLETEVVEVDYI